jgi:hypothetical protein
MTFVTLVSTFPLRFRVQGGQIVLTFSALSSRFMKVFVNLLEYCVNSLNRFDKQPRRFASITSLSFQEVQQATNGENVNASGMNPRCNPRPSHLGEGGGVCQPSRAASMGCQMEFFDDA